MSSMTTKTAASLLVSQIRIDRGDLGHGGGVGAFPDHGFDRSALVRRQRRLEPPGAGRLQHASPANGVAGASDSHPELSS